MHIMNIEKIIKDDIFLLTSIVGTNQVMII